MDRNPSGPASVKAEGPYLGSKQAAFHLGLSWQTLKRLRLIGKGPVCHLHSGQWRYYIVDLDAWLAARRKGGQHD